MRPLQGQNYGKNKRRGKPLRYKMPSLRDLMFAMYLPDTNKLQRL